jgi:plastocyanin
MVLRWRGCHRYWRAWSWLLGTVVAVPVGAAELSLRIVDAAGTPGTQLAVLARPVGNAASIVSSRPPVRVVQQFQTFAPEVTPVAVGTKVEFPNFDRMRHHVYSFSAAKPFEIRLYSGDEIPSITFDKPGAIAIGCNIHDWMEGYVYVTEAPYFAGTDGEGTATLTGIPPGEYRVSVWHPSFSAEVDLASASVPATGATLSLTLATRMQPFSQHRPEDDPLLSRFKSASE